MGRYWQYLKYVIRHKWFVYKAGTLYFPFSLRLQFRLIVHDISKFYPSEFVPYAKTFYKPDGSKQYDETPAFNITWNHHQKRNKHHWQYWLLKMDSGDVIAIDMPDIYISEMLADWVGAGKSITGNWNHVFKWYDDNKDKLQVSDNTKEKIHSQIYYLCKRMK